MLAAFITFIVIIASLVLAWFWIRMLLHVMYNADIDESDKMRWMAGIAFTFGVVAYKYYKRYYQPTQPVIDKEMLVTGFEAQKHAEQMPETGVMSPEKSVEDASQEHESGDVIDPSGASGLSEEAAAARILEQTKPEIKETPQIIKNEKPRTS